MKEGALQELPEGWVWTRLEEISDIILGQSPPSSTYNEDRRGLPFYQGKLEFGSIYPTPQKWCTVPKKISEKGDVLISVRAPVGPTNICSEKSCIGRGLAAIRPLGGIETFFTLYLMRAFENSIAEKGTGTTFGAITGNKLKEFDIPLPPLPEQRAIVSKIEQVFSDLNNGIENFKKAQAQLKLYRQSVLKAACEGKLVPTEAELARAQGRSYEPADVLLARIFKERREKWNGKGKYKEVAAPDMSEQTELPEGWRWATLEQLSWDSGYGTSEKCDYNFSGPPVLRIPNISEGHITLNDIKFASESTNLNETESLAIGDMLVIRTNGSKDLIGRVGVVTQNFNKPYFFASYLIRFRIVEFSGLPIWLSSIWHTPRIRSWIESVAATSAGQYNISMSALNKLPLELPPLAEQRRIVAEVERYLSVSDKMEATITESLQKAESLRQSILKKAFEGKLLNKKELEKARNAPDWEPAEKLLERILQEKAQIGEKKRKR